ncbi:MAG: 50S ribosomal protein L10 [Patescibacteria group bacterium]|jgi:large subunit ribosomal protein L10
MAKSKQQKQATVAGLEAQIDGMKSVIFIATDKLTVKEETKLRQQLRAGGVPFSVVKKTLLSRALEAKGIKADGTAPFRGTIAAAFGVADEVQPAALLNSFMKGIKTVKFMGGVLNGQWMTAAQVSSLAKLPSKAELLAKLVGTLQGPTRGFVGVLAGPMRGFIQVLKAKAEKTS